jgi:hypothetical protein
MDEEMNFHGMKFTHEIMVTRRDISSLGTFVGIMFNYMSRMSLYMLPEPKKKTRMFLARCTNFKLSKFGFALMLKTMVEYVHLH